MKAIVALGNPGIDYKNTRHNVGFFVIDQLADQWGSDFADKPKFKAQIAETLVNGEKVLLIKPTTFYNLVGESARTIKDFYKLDNSNILVIHDDMALPFGTIRARVGGSSAGNNGIKSLNQHLGEDYARIRIGIWSPHRVHAEATDFVLGTFSQQEQANLSDVTTQHIVPLVDSFVGGTFDHHTIKN